MTIVPLNMNATTVNKKGKLFQPPDKLNKTTGNINEKKHFEEQVSLPEGGQLTALHLLAINGNKAVLQEKLNKNAHNINQTDHMGRTPLIYSVLGDQYECALLLLKAGAKIDETDVDNRTALHWACYQGNQKLVKLLLSKGADHNLQEKELRTPLHLSTFHDNIKVIQALLRCVKGKEIDTPDNNQMTALCWCVYYDRVESTRLLLKHGASPASFDKDFRTVLHWTSTNKDPTILKLLLEHVKDKDKQQLNFEDNKGQTLLHMAVGQSNISLVEYLVSLPETKLNSRDQLERTPLHWAAILKEVDMVRLLLHHKAEHSVGDKNGIRPLHYAVQSGSLETVEAMLNSNANIIDEPAGDQRTALMWASVKGNDQIMKLLLDKKCSDVNAVDVNEQSALHMCMQSGHLQSVKVLIDAGADVNMVDGKHHIPLFYACASGHADVVTELIDRGSDKQLEDKDLEGRCPLHYAAMVDRTDIIKILLRRQLDPNTQDNAGCPPLHFAAYGGFVHSMSALLENGADVNLPDNDKQTALHWACRSGSLDAVKLLVARFNANVNAFHYGGGELTPLDYALLEDHQDVALYLTENNAFTGAYIKDTAATKIRAVYLGYSFRKTFRKDILKRHLSKRKFQPNLSAVGEQQELDLKNSNSNTANKQRKRSEFGWSKYQVLSFSTEQEGSALETLLKNIQHSTQLNKERTSSPSLGEQRKSSSLSNISLSSKSSIFLTPDRAKNKIINEPSNPLLINKSNQIDVKTFLKYQRTNSNDALNSSQTSVKNADNVISFSSSNSKDSPDKLPGKRESGDFFPTNPSITSSHSSSELFLHKQDKNNLINKTYSRYYIHDNRSIISSSTNSNSVFETRIPSSAKPTASIPPINQNELPKSSTTNTQHYETRNSLLSASSQQYESCGSLTTLSSQMFKPRGSLTTNHLTALTGTVNQRYGSHSSLSNLSTNLESEKPWDIYRRDKKRIDLIRQKTNAAITIQIWFRYYQRRQKSKMKRTISRQDRVFDDITCEIDLLNENISEKVSPTQISTLRSSPKWSREQWKHSLSGLNLSKESDSENFLNPSELQNNSFNQNFSHFTKGSLDFLSREPVESVDSFDSDESSIPDQETLEEVAALVIQLAWRQYVKNKLLKNIEIVEENKNQSVTAKDNNEKRTTKSVSVKRNKSVSFNTYRKTDLGAEEEKNKSVDVVRSESLRTSASPSKDLASTTSFPLMQNAYRRSMRKKRGKKFSIKKKLLPFTSTHSGNDNKNEMALKPPLTKDEMAAVKTGKAKLFLNKKAHSQQ